MCVFVHSCLGCYVLTPFQMQRLCGNKLDTWMWTTNRAERRAWIWNVVMDCFKVRYDPVELPRRNLWRFPELPVFDSDAYRMQIMHITIRFHRPTSCECTDDTRFPLYLARWWVTQSDDGGAAAVLSVFTVPLSPLF